MHLRRATRADLAVIVEYNRRLARETEGHDLDPDKVTPGVAAAIDDPAKGPYFLAEVSGEVVGQLQVTTEWSDWRNGWFWWIQSVYVRQDFRRKGVFRALYAHVERMAREDGTVVGLRLYVEHENHAAQATYLGLGMSRTGYLLLEKSPL